MAFLPTPGAVDRTFEGFSLLPYFVYETLEFVYVKAGGKPAGPMGRKTVER
jgi:hypothetical protein